MELSKEIIERIKKLEEKYQVMGQDLVSYLDGLLYADYLTYWDYIRLDVLLNIQNPRTHFPDENIFILYHQITELYFKLILHAQQRIANEEKLTPAFFEQQLARINSYFANLINSFEIMIEGMEKDQFLSFRMALLPASGFQSAQYRMIEICSTDISNLVSKDKREVLSKNGSVDKIYENLYWKHGATELSSGKKTLTLRQFEVKYSKLFTELIEEYKAKNLWARYHSMPDDERSSDSLINAMKQFDTNVNIEWSLMHYKSAAKYLQQEPEVIAATGGTNWQKYLPPKNQQIIFFPELWSEEEKAGWGK